MKTRTCDISARSLMQGKALRLLELTHQAWGLHERPQKKTRKHRIADWPGHFDQRAAHAGNALSSSK